MRRHEPKYPVGTLDRLVGQFWIYLSCECGHASRHDPADLAERFGRDHPLAELVAKGVCAECGRRGAMLRLRAPTLTDQSDRPRQLVL